ncbi:MAG: hypothetical protein WBL20_18075 [Sphingobium sp.]
MKPVYRLSRHLASRRVLYPSITIAAPSVLVIDIPPLLRGDGLALGRYYAIILETDFELRELEDFLDAPRDAPVAPDLLDHRPSGLRSDSVLISRYEPPEEGWPWLLVCRWPEFYAAIARGMSDCAMARGCYTTELFEHPEDLDAHSLALLESLGKREDISIRLIAAEALPPAGNA